MATNKNTYHDLQRKTSQGFPQFIHQAVMIDTRKPLRTNLTEFDKKPSELIEKPARKKNFLNRFREQIGRHVPHFLDNFPQSE